MKSRGSFGRPEQPFIGDRLDVSVPIDARQHAPTGRQQLVVTPQFVFVFELGGPLGAIRSGDSRAYFVPAQPLAECFRNQQVLVFTGVWFGLNLMFGLMSGPLAGQPASVAWQAHIGGFIAGLALVPFFNPVPQRRGV